MRRPLLLLLWLLSDSALFVGAFALAYFLRVGWVLSTDFPFDRFIVTALAVAPLWLLTLVATRTFSLMRAQRSLRTGMYIVYASVVATALFVLGYYFLYGLFFSRLLLLYAFGGTAALTWGWHIVFDRLQRGLLRRSPPAYPTLIVGATREARALIATLRDRRSPLTPVAILDGRGTSEQEIEGVPVRGKLNKIEDVLESERITHLIQCSDLEQSLNLLSACRNRRITYLLLPSVLGIVERDERIDALEGRPVTVVRPPEPGWKWFF
jgi:FlaA1/EpsC-like NDP-sugar epimerase